MYMYIFVLTIRLTPSCRLFVNFYDGSGLVIAICFGPRAISCSLKEFAEDRRRAAAGAGRAPPPRSEPRTIRIKMDSKEEREALWDLVQYAVPDIDFGRGFAPEFFGEGSEKECFFFRPNQAEIFVGYVSATTSEIRPS